jgi:predicted transcriptional regulator of viral defense system
MTKSKSQALVQFAMCHNNSITTKQANDLIGHTYYCNGAHHVSEMLTRLVKNGTLVRESRGNYILKSVQSVKNNSEINNPNQNKLEL